MEQDAAGHWPTTQREGPFTPAFHLKINMPTSHTLLGKPSTKRAQGLCEPQAGQAPFETIISLNRI